MSPAFFLGAFILLAKKGTHFHRTSGKIYRTLMVITAIIVLFMPARVGPTLFNHFGYLHLFSALTLEPIPSALIAIRKGNIKRHKREMILLYVGAILISGSFTFIPGRFLCDVFF